jgi:hypothetical protein
MEIGAHRGAELGGLIEKPQGVVNGFRRVKIQIKQRLINMVL